MMSHKKSKHIESIRFCNLILDGECPFKEETCWFKHAESPTKPSEDVKIDDEGTNTPVFQEVQEDLEPPIVTSRTKKALATQN